MADRDPIALSYSTLAGLKSQVAHLSTAFTNTVAPVERTEGELHTGAGEFATYLAYGAAEFRLAWTSGLTAMAQGSALISNNIGRSSLDFHAVDVAASNRYIL